MLRDQQKKLELAGRMYKLWEESGHTQEAVADAIGLKHRSYQKALQTGGISYERLRKLAEFHKVDFDWLLRGEERGPTPELSVITGDEDGGTVPKDLRDQLDRIEAEVAAMRKDQRKLIADLRVVLLEEFERGRAAMELPTPGQAPASGGRPPRSSRAKGRRATG